MRDSVVDKLRQAVTTRLNEQKNRATDQLGTVAQATRQNTQQLRDHNLDRVAGYVDQVADQIDHLSQQLRDTTIAELLQGIKQLSERQPSLFIGGAFALGFIGARFLKSTAGASRRDSFGARRSRVSLPRGIADEYRAYARAGGEARSAFANRADHNGNHRR